MIIKRIRHLNTLIGVEILTLVEKINDPELDLTLYWKFLKDNVDHIGLFGAFNEGGELMGFTHAEEPTMTAPRRAYLCYASVDPSMPHTASVELLEATKQWMGSVGATYFFSESQRSQKAIQRAFGFKALRQQMYVAPVNSDDYLELNIEQD